ncbi:nucleotidyltransferase [Alkalihalophilus sp. As8PL]|uniref:tRNA(Met) cytidine acetate ligase n=1 Tax=Alkalihalophilus sp. As8PL TaxID=3237103 RepID=A0AB39BSY9_9BACI
MRSVGVVVEYNPLHNGHAYHLQEARKITEADVVIAVMSGCFLQRGEPALLSKWERAKMALLAGVDVVVELPYAYSTQKAEVFAEGAIKVLSALGVDNINFGSEMGVIEPFYDLVRFMKMNKSSWDDQIKAEMDTGVSYPRAAMEAFKQLNQHESILSLSQPNNILGYHYVKAISDLNVPMGASTTKRTVAQYHDMSVTTQSIASATSIRKNLSQHEGLQSIHHVVPKTSYQILKEYFNDFGTYHTWELYFSYLQYEILRSTPAQLRSIYECEEGLEFRLIDTIMQASTFQEWMTLLKTKRYTWTRLQRLATHILTNTTKEEMSEVTSSDLAYIRLLGMNETGQQYLNQVKKDLPCPLISRFAKAEGTMAKMDDRIAKIYSIPLVKKNQHSALKRDYTMSPIMKKNTNKEDSHL